MVSKFVTYSGLTLYFGLSTDELPKDVPNGSRFTAIDTDDEYWYDRENQGWYNADGQFIPDYEEEGDEEVMFINMSYDDSTDVFTIDKTVAQMKAALDSGKFLILAFDTGSAESGIMYMPLVKYWEHENYGDSFEFDLVEYGENGDETEVFIQYVSVEGDDRILFDRRPSHEDIG